MNALNEDTMIPEYFDFEVWMDGDGKPVLVEIFETVTGILA